MTLDIALSNLTGLVDLGGPVVAILLAMSLISLAVVIYKIGQFVQAGVGRHDRLRRASAALDRGEGARARQLLGDSRSHLAPLAVQMLDRMEAADPETYQARVEVEAAERLDRLETGFRLLDSIAQVAPLLGLFGTVLGMIDAFQALQEAGDSVDPSILAGGIWVALMTTAAGLAVAMPTALILTWFETRTEAERAMADGLIRRAFCPVSSARTGAAEPHAALVPHAS
ncbi:MotA/TolQ/ExbB proton channel family protein [Gymnodinialimonas ceratoperidinii]|uniref:MotA/TolQ/ExbB proton channel family protein n=1 Tax=Gymnodinialimonas ceratoperidinii TaxID=2856823 RepID=A0A8F6TU17_9RHOB|nr:MotA/TolQ/ExbB proton channel family protein [Gymnodinialimonas ceratoperidinii]QXT38951.1 MotA/TolQ/ExbB proton channel family protein [Gymnodinialimonas ceratoperidinii]